MSTEQDGAIVGGCQGIAMWLLRCMSEWFLVYALVMWVVARVLLGDLLNVLYECPRGQATI